MKDPIYITGTVAAMVAPATLSGTPVSAERIMMMLAAGFCSGLYSLWKSRKRKADRADSISWVGITVAGSMSLAWALGPIIADRELFGGVMLTLPAATLIIGMSGAPAIEWMLDGSAFKWLKSAWEWWRGGGRPQS